MYNCHSLDYICGSDDVVSMTAVRVPGPLEHSVWPAGTCNDTVYDGPAPVSCEPLRHGVCCAFPCVESFCPFYHSSHSETLTALVFW